MKKIIGAIFIIFLLSATTFVASTKITTEDTLLNEEIKQLETGLNVNATNTSILSVRIHGPILKQYTNLDIKINSNKAEKINKIVNGLLPRFVRTREWIPVIVTGLTFTIEFKQNVSSKSKFNYYTEIINQTINETGVIINNSISAYSYCTTHTITVENFTGVFFFSPFELIIKGLLTSWHPAKFWFIGSCTGYNYTNQTLKTL